MNESIARHRQDAESDLAQAKDALRQTLMAARRRRSDDERLAAARANAGHLNALLSGTRVVCAYLPLASEPLRIELLDELVAGGCTVLVPVVAPRAPLDWCTYPCPTSPGSFGIAEPDGPRLGPRVTSEADAILVPALAVDLSGSRLGRGGGHYDRTLALLEGAPALVAVLFDDEMLGSIPTGGYDRPVTAAVRPSSGILRLPG